MYSLSMERISIPFVTVSEILEENCMSEKNKGERDSETVREKGRRGGGGREKEREGEKEKEKDRVKEREKVKKREQK